MRFNVSSVVLMLLLLAGVVACNESNSGLQAGRFQLILVAPDADGAEREPYLLDSATGKVWRKIPKPDGYNYWDPQFHPSKLLLKEE
jgi:hypothetical protein